MNDAAKSVTGLAGEPGASLQTAWPQIGLLQRIVPARRELIKSG